MYPTADVQVLTLSCTSTHCKKTGVTKTGVTKTGVTKTGVTKTGVTKTGVTKKGVTKTGVIKTGVTEPPNSSRLHRRKPSVKQPHTLQKFSFHSSDRDLHSCPVQTPQKGRCHNVTH